MNKKIRKGDTVECISNEGVDFTLNKGWFYEVTDLSTTADGIECIWVKSNDGKSRGYAAERFRLKEKKKLTLKDLFIGKIVVADYSEPAVAWVCGLATNPVGEVIVKIKRADDSFGREIPIHPNNLTELE